MQVPKFWICPCFEVFSRQGLHDFLNRVQYTVPKKQTKKKPKKKQNKKKQKQYKREYNGEYNGGKEMQSHPQKTLQMIDLLDNFLHVNPEKTELLMAEEFGGLSILFSHSGESGVEELHLCQD